MKTIIVISDSHGNRSVFEEMNTVLEECDYIIHLGDTSSDGFYLKKQFPDKTYLLNGNCDMTKFGVQELVLEIEGVRIFACHGDAYGVKTGYDRLAQKAREEDCSVALFGHTHKAGERSINGVKLFNPGTLSRFSEHSYLYLVIADGKAVGKLVKVN